MAKLDIYRGEALTEWYPRPDGTERAVVFAPGYLDTRTGPHTFGKHGMEIRWLLRGPRGAAQFMIYTDWVPGQEGGDSRTAALFPIAVDLGYHALVPQYEGQEDYGRQDCDILGGQCYYDGSGMAAERVLPVFIREGESAIWAALEARYEDISTEPPEATDA